MCFMIRVGPLFYFWCDDGKPFPVPPWLVYEDAAMEFLVRLRIGLLPWSELPESAFK